MTLPLLYTDVAALWPLISPPGDYIPEAEALAEFVEEQRRRRGQKPALLELGVGGGHTLSHIASGVEAVGVDISAAMLANCRKLVPSAKLVQADLREVRLNQRFDVILLHDAADYLLTKEDLQAAMRTVSAHLAPDGVAAIAPTYVRETFEDHELCSDQQSDGNGLTVSYLSYVHDPNSEDSEFEMILVYLINENGSVRVVEDRHRCGLFSSTEWMEEMRAAALVPEYREEDHWNLFVVRHDVRP